MSSAQCVFEQKPAGANTAAPGGKYYLKGSKSRDAAVQIVFIGALDLRRDDLADA